jgi:hypothetical protein
VHGVHKPPKSKKQSQVPTTLVFREDSLEEAALSIAAEVSSLIEVKSREGI